MKVTFLNCNLPVVTPILKFKLDELRRDFPMAQWDMWDSKYTHETSNDFWTLTEDWMVRYRIDGDLNTYTFMLEKGWITDFGSVPLWARSLVNHVDPDMIIAFLVHDIIYATHYINDRSYADNILLAIMNKCGASKIRSSLAYYAVRVGGALCWKKNDEHINYEKQWANFGLDVIGGRP